MVRGRSNVLVLVAQVHDREDAVHHQLLALLWRQRIVLGHLQIVGNHQVRERANATLALCELVDRTGKCAIARQASCLYVRQRKH